MTALVLVSPEIESVHTTVKLYVPSIALEVTVILLPLSVMNYGYPVSVKLILVSASDGTHVT